MTPHALRSLRALPKTAQPFAVRSIQSSPQILPPLTHRTYATSSSDASYGQTSNASNPQASSAESQSINKSRATDSTPQQDTKSVQTPVSNPGEMGLGAQEESTESQEAMKRDPKESDEKKREKVLGWGQGKKLDPADE